MNYLVVDIEKNGNALTSPLLAIGYCHGRISKDGKEAQVLMSGRVCIKRDSKEALSEFWSHPDRKSQLDIMDKEAIPFKQAMAQFIQIVDSMHIDELLSDNPSYDFGNLDYALLIAQRDPLRYDKDGKYRATTDVDSLLQGFTREERSRIERLANEKSQHTHLPDDDARNIFWQFALVHDLYGVPRRD